MGVGHYHTDVSLLKFCKAKNNTGEKKRRKTEESVAPHSLDAAVP